MINPWIAFLLAIVTFGGLLIVPPFISQWRFYNRIGRAQELDGLEHRISQVTEILLFALALFFLPFEIAYAQHHLNRLWEREAELGTRGEVAPRRPSAEPGRDCPWPLAASDVSFVPTV